jgi:membrane associated rhomboid family serine protease
VTSLARPRSFLQAARLPAGLVLAIWAAFLVDAALPFDAFRAFGLVPRTASGAWGIVGMPFVHAGWSHVAGNTTPLLVLSTLLVLVGRGPGTVAAIVLGNGALLWLFGRTAVHGGASGLVFGLAGFLVALGFVQKRPATIVVALVVVVLYGGLLAVGVLPTHPGVSWDGHLTGAVAGVLVARVRSSFALSADS